MLSIVNELSLSEIARNIHIDNETICVLVML